MTTGAPLLVVMGVSGSGKSMVGALLAEALGLVFLEGDALHSAQNIARMASGIALTDADRREWLEQLSDRLAQAARSGQGLVVSCSALKRVYRDLLRRGAPRLCFVYLAGDAALLAARTAARLDHYMPPSLLGSQLDTLEPPGADENALRFDVVELPHTIVHSVLRALRDVPAQS